MEEIDTIGDFIVDLVTVDEEMTPVMVNPVTVHPAVSFNLVAEPLSSPR